MLAGTVLTGCAGGVHGASPPPSASVTTVTATSGEPSPADPGSDIITHLRRRVVPVGALPARAMPRADFRPAVVLPDGGQFGGTLHPDVTVACEGDATLLTLDGAATTVTPRSDGHIGECVESGDGDDTHVVWWSEQGSTELYNVPWVIRSYDRRTGAVRELAHFAVDAGGAPVATPYMDPELDHGVVVWAAGHGDRAAAYAAPADGSLPPRMVEDDAGDIEIAWPYAFVLKRDTDVDADGDHYHLLRIDLRDDSRMRMPGEVAGAFAVGHDQVFVDRPDGVLEVTDLEGRVQLSYRASFASRTLQADAVVGGFVVSNEDGSYLLDVDGRSLILLGGRSGANDVRGNGAWVWWTDAVSADQRSGTDWGDPAASAAMEVHATVDQIKAASTLGGPPGAAG